MSNSNLPRYAFSNIPNNEEGRQLVALMKKYLNPRYSITVRGQYQSEESKKKGERYPFGSPIKASKCLRVYVDDSAINERIYEAQRQISNGYRVRFAALRKLEEAADTLRGLSK